MDDGTSGTGLWISTTRGSPAGVEDCTAQEPVSPTARLMDGSYIVVSIGLGAPLNLPVFRAGTAASAVSKTMIRFDMYMEVMSEEGTPRWVVCTEVNMDNHLIVPRLDPAALEADPDKAVEDYVASLSRFPDKDHSRPAWEFHLLDVPTSEAASTAAIRLPAMLSVPTRKGAIYARPRPPKSAGALAFLLTWTRFVHRSLCLDDVKFLKNAMNCTVNDVLVGVTSAALSQYYFGNSGKISKLCVRSILFVNLRPTHSLQTYVNMIESGDSNDVKWGNRLGYIILPFHIAMHNDPLEYVRKAKKTVERKKSSLEVIFTNMVTEFIIKTLGAKVVFCGHPVSFIAPSLYGAPEALFVHYQSYGSTMKVILAVDEAVFPDYHKLLDDFSESLQLIKGAASRLPTTSIKND
ncbi:hypothetical protein BRADI_3g15950v3 [Brachypodium distachyon]|uniref:O-acyltransferase WSD1 C-terminal domain-containing protein n=1 Tax=Brachypodium distachyon TaxID=15368 RepID=A0A0Q3JAG0_BRADI|nr:hypothetical protein BRADI_3g15950v3 [Brachypodium distachyon]